MTTPKPIEHRLPTPATVKEMYATAFRCGHPKCRKPLYRINDATGELTLNSTVAHIHARRQNGPRWHAAMTEAENRDEANLILLCLEHSAEVDDVPDDYPAEEMRAWKVTVLAEYDEFHQKWDLSEKQVAEVLVKSSGFRESARTAVESETLTQCVRLGATLIEHAVTARRPAHQIATAWVALCDQHTRQSMAWDENGEVLRVHPPQGERRRFTAEMVAALTGARTLMEPTVQALVAELRALNATNAGLGDWCEWVGREARAVLAHGITATLEAAPAVDTEELSRALAALSAKWRGEEAVAPPPPPESAALPEPDAAARGRAATAALNTQARSWLRVKTRAYDPELYDNLVTVLPYAATLPPVLGNTGIRLVDLAELAAAVARNADDDVAEKRIEEAARLGPLAVAVAVLNNLKNVATETGREVLAHRAAELAKALIAGQSWSEPEPWKANVLHCRTLLDMAVSQTSADHVRTMVTEALTTLAPTDVLLAIAEWREQYANLDFKGPGRPDPYIRQLPDWLPRAELEVAVRAEWPDLSNDDLDSADVERRLAAEFLNNAGTL